MERLTLARHPDWPIRLNQYIAGLKDVPFDYGSHDCCLFVAGAVQAMTGVDPMPEFRGQYDATSWQAVLQTTGYQGSLFKTLYAKFGKPTHGAKGRRGDIAWHEGCCGLVINRHAMFFNNTGYVFLPISKLRRVFRVG